jgi:outer membrane protein assembly factor BamB
VTFSNRPVQSGWYDDQPMLDPAAVSSSTFGQLFSTPIDGQAYAAPTVVAGTLIVATETNHVYGLDPATGGVRWTQTLGAPVHSSDIPCGDLAPTVGITSTPAVDGQTGTAYLTSKTYVSGTSGPAKYVVYAIDVASGEIRWSRDVAGAAANDPSVAFDATYLLQRPALTLMDGVVYAAFSGFCDTPPYFGWVAGVSTAGALTTLWTSESGQNDASPEGGIWHAAGPITSDRPGDLLVVTGNGNTPPTGPASLPAPGALGQAVIRLRVQPDGSLTAVDYFSPANADDLNVTDLDMGSSALELLPAEQFGTPTVPNLAVTGSKGGSLYVLDRSFLGGRGQGPTGGDGIVQRIDGVGAMWSTPTFWVGDGGYVYQTVAFHGLQAYRYSVGAGDVPAFQLAGSSPVVGYGSSSPIVTSNGTTPGSALVWMVAKLSTGDELRAYDPVPLADGTMRLRGAWPVGQFAKFNRITVSDGRVYVGTRDGHVVGFGFRGQEALGGVMTDGPAAAAWSAGRLDVFVRGVDGQLWHKWFDGAWSGWTAASPSVSSGPAATTATPHLNHVFWRDGDSSLVHLDLSG